MAELTQIIQGLPSHAAARLGDIVQRIDLTRRVNMEDVARASGWTQRDIEMMRVFMEPAFNEGRVYLSPQLIKEFLATKSTSVGEYIRRHLLDKYTINVDYFILDPDNEADSRIMRVMNNFMIVKPPRPSRGDRVHYAVTGRCFKELVMKSSSENSSDFRDYYLRLEELVRAYEHLTIMSHYVILKQSTQLAIAAEPEKMPDAASWIYIATTPRYAESNLYKPGRTANLDARLAQYNRGRAMEDQYYYARHWPCYYARECEAIIRTVTVAYIDGEPPREMRRISLELLVSIIESVVRLDRKLRKRMWRHRRELSV